MSFDPTAKVPVYSATDLKNTTDDAIVFYLTKTLPKKNRFVADNTKSNIRLLLGYSAVSIAGVSFYIDYMKGWEATQPWIKYAVIAYFTLNVIFTIWTWFVEGGQIFEGTTSRGDKLHISTSIKKFSPLYSVQFRHTSPSGEIVQDKSIKAPLTKWFSADGMIQFEPFEAWLQSEIDIVAQAATGESNKKK
ncbi:hypothetical protein FQN57_005467 [Myotisia sp. PD_48]|nr:hypothetical protein FQN57_005467 [Myotisia sp. PD_48]